jgi:hypothetical protein
LFTAAQRIKVGDVKKGKYYLMLVQQNVKLNELKEAFKSVKTDVFAETLYKGK